jgi:hypothetical protein
METIQEALMKWGEAMQVIMENRSLFYSPVLKRWRVKKWSGKNARKFIYEGESFQEAFEYLQGTRFGGEDPD